MSLPKIDPNQFVRTDVDKLRGKQDPRGPVGILSRGKPIYGGFSNAAHRGGGPQFGRPKKGSMQELTNAIARRLGESYGNK